MSADQVLKRFSKEMKRRIDFWHKNTNDPHNISTAVYVALTETNEAINDALEGLKKQKKTK